MSLVLVVVRGKRMTMAATTTRNMGTEGQKSAARTPVQTPDEWLIAENFRVLAGRDQSGAAEKRPIK